MLLVLGALIACASPPERLQSPPGKTAAMLDERLGEMSFEEALQRGEPRAIEAMLRLAFRSQLHDPRHASDLQLYVPDDYMERSKVFGTVGSELASYDLHPNLRELEIPTLLIYGAAEPSAELGAPALAKAISGSRLEVLPGAGHFAFLEQPGEFLELVRDFLAGLD